MITRHSCCNEAAIYIIYISGDGRYLWKDEDINYTNEDDINGRGDDEAMQMRWVYLVC